MLVAKRLHQVRAFSSQAPSPVDPNRALIKQHFNVDYREMSQKPSPVLLNYPGVILDSPRGYQILHKAMPYFSLTFLCSGCLFSYLNLKTNFSKALLFGVGASFSAQAVLSDYKNRGRMINSIEILPCG